MEPREWIENAFRPLCGQGVAADGATGQGCNDALALVGWFRFPNKALLASLTSRVRAARGLDIGDAAIIGTSADQPAGRESGCCDAVPGGRLGSRNKEGFHEKSMDLCGCSEHGGCL